MKLHKKFSHDLPGVGYWGERSDVKLRINFGKLNAGETFPEDWRHYHRTRVTYFCILEGDMKVEVDGEVVEISPETMLEITPLSVYRVLGIGTEGCSWVVVGSHNENDRVEC